nr:putative reverse transcriptase domain-containing protein [Tanacetum cinerariifolium]
SSSYISSGHLQIHYQTHHQFILQDTMHQVSLIQDHRLELHHLDWFIPWLGIHDVVRHLCVGGLYHSTLYPPTTSESSLDSSSERSIAPALADLLPRKSFKDSYSSEASREEHIEIGFRVKVATSDIKENEEEFKRESSVRGTMLIVVDPLVTDGIFEPTGGDALDLEDTLYDISHYMSEEESRQICRDHDDTWRRLRRLESLIERRFGFFRLFGNTMVITLLDIIPDTLDVSYVVDLADRRTFRTNTILRGCMLGLLGQPYNIDLMPVELGSFDVIIDMDWLANHHAVIVCDEKIMRIPYEDEILIVQGNRSGKGKKSKLSIISCTKTQNYIKKGCLIFLAQVMKKKTKDKSEEKRLEDVPTIQDFMKVFSLDLPGLPPT